MMEPGLGAVIFLTCLMVGVFCLGFFLVYRVMNKPGFHIGSRLPDEGDDEDAREESDRPSGRDDGSDSGDGNGDDGDTDTTFRG